MRARSVGSSSDIVEGVWRVSSSIGIERLIEVVEIN